MTLAEALWPIEVDDFLKNYVTQKYILIKGARGRFEKMIPWQQLSEKLSSLRIGDDRMLLIRNAKQIAKASYVHLSKTGEAGYLDGPSVSRHLAEGATLLVTQVDELFADVRSLAESCEDFFQVHVAANLYAGWRRDNAFDIHWDRHDTLILQLNGRKDWKVWAPTRLHPVHGDPVAPPTEDPAWSGTLEDGDVLYMPRGWWHVAFPKDEPTLHITLSIRHRTGKDLLNWIFEQMTDCTELRMPIPHWQDSATRDQWTQRLKAACAAAIDSSLIERYTRALSEGSHTRPFIRLPEHAIAAPQTIGTLTPLRLSRGRRLHLRPSIQDAQFSFSALGQEWQCHASLVPALAMLSSVTPCTMQEMNMVIDGDGRRLLRLFVDSLLAAGVLWADTSRPWTQNETAIGASGGTS